MGRLDGLTMADLHALLDTTEGNVPTQRVLAAIGRKQGETLQTLAHRHDVSEKTVRNWLDRFAEQPLSDAPYDEARSGRPTKLSESERARLFDVLQESPVEAGYDRVAWTPALVQAYIETNFDVEYSRRHIYRMLDEAGLSYPTPRDRGVPQHPDSDSELG